MQAVLIENNGNDRIASDTLIIEKPETLSILRSKLALNILKELAKNPACAIDVAKKLRQHEQKVYYHFRQLEKAGLIYSVSSERRYGTIAKIFSVVSPVVALKLFEKGTKIKESFTQTASPEVLEFFSPFIDDGKWNAKIIIGSTKTHGKYEARAVDTPYLIDFLLFLGSLIKDFDSSSITYKFDTDVKENDLKNNIILVGNPKINSVTDMINQSLPINFDVNTDFRIVSTITKSKYPYDFDAVIIKIKNPFNQDKELLLIAGKRSEGLRSATLALMNHTKEILGGNVRNKNIIAKVVSGVDKDSDGMIDDVKFYE